MPEAYIQCCSGIDNSLRILMHVENRKPSADGVIAPPSKASQKGNRRGSAGTSSLLERYKRIGCRIAGRYGGELVEGFETRARWSVAAPLPHLYKVLCFAFLTRECAIAAGNSIGRRLNTRCTLRPPAGIP